MGVIRLVHVAGSTVYCVYSRNDDCGKVMSGVYVVKMFFKSCFEDGIQRQ